MATIKGVYEVLKQKQKNGEDIGMFGESFIEMYEKEKVSSTTKEVHTSLIKYEEKKGINSQLYFYLTLEKNRGFCFFIFSY